MTPIIGQPVLYKISEYDAEQINRRRRDAGAFLRRINAEPETAPGEHGKTGHVLHMGNEVSDGDVYPAFVVASFGGSTVNLHVLLDGNDTYWATSRAAGADPAHWLPAAAPEPAPADEG